MKKIINLAIVFAGTALSAQIAIEKNSISSPSVSLEFGDAPKGLVLPWANSVAEVEAKGVVPGSIIFDLSDRAVKVFTSDPVNPGWFVMSNPDFFGSGPVDSSLQDNLEEAPDAKVIIGANPATEASTNGILILSDTDKAMILPKMDSPQLNIKNPAAGMIVFDTYTKFLMMFDGTAWSYLRPDKFFD